MNSIPVMKNSSLEQISRILGDHLTGSKITNLFFQVGFNNSSTETKWRRINYYFEETQMQYHCANKVIEFISLTTDPIKFVNNKDEFNLLLNELNKILAFSGIKIDNQGKFRKTLQANTIDEAHERASNLQKILYERNIHEDVLKFCKPELLQENYFHAVFEATKSISDKIRKISQLSLDGNNLVYKVFDDNNPLIAINSLRTPSEKNEQRGLKNLLLGIFSMFRNTLAHEAEIYWPVSEQDAIDLLTMISFIHRKLDNAVKIPYQ